ncbi:hypothetical protein RFI_28290 [Reticulomyxa filosa]|uniref:Uncharacterized protein n=1 Tax=Reticulomyxa filosa TaxID=46433 RepID=X6M5B4_RETFI|nr:hypothetical protein RFI_28290 [Reticulomyxa filosa]|eukprot:ETO09104.1 hypothetical protein RFI_28290 [Reticulomyxa filosa]
MLHLFQMREITFFFLVIFFFFYENMLFVSYAFFGVVQLCLIAGKLLKFFVLWVTKAPFYQNKYLSVTQTEKKLVKKGIANNIVPRGMGSCTCIGDPQDEMVGEELAEAKRKDNMILKVLLLGAGGSGKSTFFKQLNNTYGEGYSELQRSVYKIQIYRQIVENMQQLIIQSEQIEKGYLVSGSDEEDVKTIGIDSKEKHLYAMDKSFATAANYVLKFPEFGILDETIVKHINNLWNNCEAIHRIFEHRNKLAVADSTEYFFKNITRIGAKDYVPTTEDVLLVRYRTTGMTEKTFEINAGRMKVVDVGGQRNERKKWIHCFEHVNAVIFVVSLTCYDEVPFEDVTDLNVSIYEKNNMIESLDVFEHTLRYPCFEATPFILFFNKFDLFQEKIKHTPITRAFPDFQSDTDDVQLSIDYIRQKFLDKASPTSTRPFFTHVTCATDQENVKRVFNDVQVCLVSSNLGGADLV